MKSLSTLTAIAAAALFTAGCATYSTKISPDSEAAGKKWAFCVFDGSNALADGSDDVAMIVDTAMGGCSQLNLEWRSSLAKDNLQPDFLRSYVASTESGVRKSAQGIVLKKKAAQKNQQQDKSKATKKTG